MSLLKLVNNPLIFQMTRWVSKIWTIARETLSLKVTSLESFLQWLDL